VTRDARILRRQCQELEAYFSTCWPDDEELQSLAPHGSVIVMGGKAKGRRDARFTLAVHAKHDTFPLHIRLYAFKVLATLPPEQRLVCRLVWQGQQTRRDVAGVLHCHEKTVYNRLESALQTVARALWDDAGQQQLPRT
jgi:predicted DNA-binding protein (UPF0251 family)